MDVYVILPNFLSFQLLDLFPSTKIYIFNLAHFLAPSHVLAPFIKRDTTCNVVRIDSEKLAKHALL